MPLQVYILQNNIISYVLINVGRGGTLTEPAQVSMEEIYHSDKSNGFYGHDVLTIDKWYKWDV
jgi:hypothetical protein